MKRITFYRDGIATISIPEGTVTDGNKVEKISPNATLTGFVADALAEYEDKEEKKEKHETFMRGFWAGWGVVAAMWMISSAIRIVWGL